MAAISVLHAGAATLTPIEFNAVGIPYGLKAMLDDASSVTSPADHVGAWSWDEDNFPATAKGWTHTSKWLQLELTKPAAVTLKLESFAGAPWPSSEDPARLAGTNLFPSFTLYRGWDTDSGTTTNADGTTLDQDHTFNNRGNIAWAEDVTYLDHLENATTHAASRTWILPAGQYTLNLGGNSPATLAEGRQGYRATLSTATAPTPSGSGVLAVVDFSEVGIPYGLKAVLDDASSVTSPADHVGAWSWDEDNFPATAKGWTHTSKWLQLELTKPAAVTLKLESFAGAPWPSSEDPARLAGTNLFPSFTLYRGWDTDSGTTTNADGTTLDQDHTFNNRGNIAWAEDVTYLDHLENATTHEASRTWILPAGQYTLNLGGNSPATLAEGRQGYRAEVSTQPLTTLASGSATIQFDKAAWDSLASAVGPAPVLTLTGFFDQAAVNALIGEQLGTNEPVSVSYRDQVYRMNGTTVSNRTGRTSQPTTFAYSSSNVTSHIGSIGLGGIARFSVLGGLGGTLLFGDYTLQFDASRGALGGSGWYLKGNIPPEAAAFDLLNVQIVEDGSALTLSGDLAVSWEVANLLYGTPSDTLKDVGDFAFAAVTSAGGNPVIRGISVAQGNLTVTVSSGRAKATCTLLSATDVSLPGSGWTPVGTAVFDAEGRCSFTQPVNSGDSARFFRLQQP